ncbi:MAG: diguanylate cyclase [Peptococcia bacterium]
MIREPSLVPQTKAPRILLLSLLLLGLLISSSVYAGNIKQPLAVQGVLDLTNWNFEEQGVVRLNGDWEFYWQEYRHSFPSSDSRITPSLIKIPSTWLNEYYQGKKLPSEGYATYRLTIILDPEDNNIKAIKLPPIYTAYKMYVNGQLVASRGNIGVSTPEVQPNGAPQLAFFSPLNGKLDIVIQVANFHHARGGIRNELTLGSPSQIVRLQNNLHNTQVILLGALIISGLYFLVHFFFRREDRFALYFALFCLSLSTYILFSREAPIYLLFPNINWHLAKRIEYITLYSCLPLYICFVKEIYPAKFLWGVLDIIQVFALMVLAIAVLAPATTFMHSLTFYHGLISIFIVCYVGIIIKAVREKHEGAIISITAGIISLVTVLIDLLIYYTVLYSFYGFTTIGMLVYFFSQSVILSKRSSQAINRAEKLSADNARMLDEITTLNQNLEDRISQRTAQLNEIIEVLNNEIMERTKTEQKLRLYATTDIMTGLANRFNCMDTLKQQMAMAQINDQPLTICFVDVDNLKDVNDHYGHAVGDDLIINIGNILKSQVRKSDTVGRIGGDEFLIIFPQCTREEAEKLWNRIEEKITEFNQTTDKPYKISVSHGFAENEPGRETTAQKLIELADMEMYQVKAVDI